MNDQYVRLLTQNKQTFEFPVYQGTMGEQVIDITDLGKAFFYTFDPGFTVTASCKSKITFIDGKKGVLLYRGYPVEQLAEQSDFLEICYLLIHGELPRKEDKIVFEQAIKQRIFPDTDVLSLLKVFNHKFHPMSILCSLVSALAGKQPSTVDFQQQENCLPIIEQVIAQMPVLASMIYRCHQNKVFIQPRTDLSYSENFLHMMFSKTDAEFSINPILTKAIDTIFLLHADHEQSVSASAVRLAGSTNVHPLAALVCGISALWGPAHGGANEAVINMLEEIGDENRIDEFIARAQDKNDPFRLMGFGHRVYKTFDPRAKVMKEICKEVLQTLNLQNEPLFRIALKLEKTALNNPYFIEKKLYPNVDFYSGIILRAMGFPVNMFTVIFAVGRTPGWISQWYEMISENYRISRPRQLYTGYSCRDYTSVDKR